MSESVIQKPVNPNSLHVPQSSGGMTSQAIKDIMAAYKTQSKIQLYDESSSQSTNAQNESIGVTGRDIPLSMLRASPENACSADNPSSPAAPRPHGRPSRGRMLEEVRTYGDIAKAYNAMRGVDEGEEDETMEIDDNGSTPSTDLSKIKRFEADYVEDMPNDDEGLLEILELAINNARANLEMLESLYAALSS
jgi:hypothetical protein